jgi:hypothetical protein
MEYNEAATYLKRSAQKLDFDITALISIFFVRSSLLVLQAISSKGADLGQKKAAACQIGD